jgi:hypothetical protein
LLIGKASDVKASFTVNMFLLVTPMWLWDQYAVYYPIFLSEWKYSLCQVYYVVVTSVLRRDIVLWCGLIETKKLLQ